MKMATKQISLRLPVELLYEVERHARKENFTRTDLIISWLQSALGDKEGKSVTQDESQIESQPSNVIETALTAQSVSQDGLHSASRFLGSLQDLTSAVQDLTVQISQLATAPGSTLTQTAATKTPKETNEAKVKAPKKTAKKAPKKDSKAKAKTTKKGGKPAPLHSYNGKEATIREHLQAALPQLNTSQLDRARNNINRKIKGRADKASTTTRTPAEAIEHELERLRKELEG